MDTFDPHRFIEARRPCSPDDMEFRFCMTLFATIQPQPFETMLRHRYDGKPGPNMLALLRAT